MRALYRLTLACTILFSHTITTAQNNDSSLGRYFKDYDIFTYETSPLLETARKLPTDFFLNNFQITEEYSWNLELHQEVIFSDDYVSTIGNKSFQKEDLDNLPIVLKGYDVNDALIESTITINDNFLYGLVETRSGKIYFEPLSTFDKTAKSNQYIVYKAEDAIPFEGNFCAAAEHDHRTEEVRFKAEEKNNSGFRAGECLQVDLAIANDHLVYNDRGSNVANWNAGVTANVNTDYDDAFDDEIRFVIVETYISQNSSQDTWGAATDAGDLLNNFSSWAPSNFSNQHDLGGLWTGVNITYGGNASTIGLAWKPGVCGSLRYHVLEDYNGSSASVRNLVSHEIGHNFSLSHVGESGKIMTGSVSGTSTWSTAVSIPAMNAFYPGLSCLGNCDGSPPPPSGDAPDANFSAMMIQECNPTQVQMTDLSTNDPTAWSWQFENGSPSTSSTQNPVVNFPGGGNYRVTLTASNEHGSDTRILIMTLNVTPAPTANYGYSISGNTVNFTNSSTGATSYNWTFGDGNNSNATNPSHTFSGPGSYSVSLLASNDCGNDTETKTIVIVDNVTSNFTASPTSTCEGESIQFTNLSSANVTDFFWEFEGGSPSSSTQENPSVTYNGSGTFNAKLTVSNASASDVENKINYIAINDTPNPSFTYEENGYTVSFDNNTTNGTAYSWNFGDGNSSSSANPTHTYSGPGTYIVVLTSSNACGSDNFQSTVVIEETVEASFEASATTGCEGTEISFTSTSTGGVTDYFWEFENGIPSTSTSPNPTVTYNQDGNFNAKLTASNSANSDIELKSNFINITGAPNVSFTYDQNDYTFVFDNNTIGGITYNWDFGDGNSTTSANPTHTYTSPGTYTVTLSSVNSCGSEETGQIVTIEEILEADFDASSNEVCVGESINFSSTSVGEIESISWEFEGGTPSTSSEENPTITFNSEGNFDVTLTIQSIHGTTDVVQLTNYVTVSEYAEADFSYVLNEFTLEFNNLSSNFNTLFWNFGDGNTSSATIPTHTYAEEGDYTVTLTATNECGSDIKEVAIPVFDQLLANFQASKTTVCPGEELMLEDLSTGNPSEWNWLIEGSTMLVAEEQNPMISIEEPGIYNVQLTVSNSEEENTKTLNQYIEVMALPTSDFDFEQDELTFTFINNSTSSNEFIWNFGDGNTSNLISPTHTYEVEGDYVVNLQSIGDCESAITESNIAAYNRLIADFTVESGLICAGNTVQYQDRSSGNASAWNWSFPGGTPSASTEQNPIVTYEQAGVFNATLVVNNAQESDESTQLEILEVQEIEQVVIDAQNDQYLATLSSNFQESGDLLWDFGDGNTSSEQSPTHEYENEGLYEITLITSNACGFDTTFTEIKIQAEIEADFSASNTEICPGSMISFDETTSKNIISWEWNFPGASPEASTERNPQVIYNETGQYPVTLTVKSLFDEQTISYESYVKVLEKPQADFEYEINKGTVQFINLSSSSGSYQWLFTDENTSAEENPIFTFEVEGIYEVKLIATNNCQSDTLTKIIDLYNEAKTYVNFGINGNNYCLGDQIAFLDLSSEDITEWNWKFEGATPSESSEKNPEVVYNEFGSFDVELTVSNGFNTRTILYEDYVTIVEAPTATFNYELEGNQISIVSQSEHASKYLWDLGDGMTANGESVTHTYASNGIYKISLKVENSCGVSTVEEEIEIDVYPEAGFSLDVAQGCAPLSVNFENRSSESTEEVIWLLEGFDEPISDMENPSVIYDMAGSYGIKIIAINSYGTDTFELEDIIEVSESPELIVEHTIEGLLVQFNSQVSNYDSILWDFGNGEFSKDLSPTHEYAETGDYKVRAVAYLGECTSEIEIEISLLSTSTVDIQSSSFKIFPNPNQGEFVIELQDSDHVEMVQILDQLGQLVSTRKLNHITNQIFMDDLSVLPPGNYIVSISLKDERPIFEKLIIVK